MIPWLLAAAATAAERLAVVVGANAAMPDTAPLRFAHHDAARVADVLRSLGGFDVVELHDPSPARLLGVLRAQGDDGVLLFYYSGHADGEAVYPGGQRLALSELRAVLQRDEPALTVGVLDACAGAGWTRAKGWIEDPAPFPLPSGVPSVGVALVAATSGDERAHEDARIRGSYFTHHLVAGLRGAADADGNGEITLLEAFGHARDATTRQAALMAPSPQVPSFHLDLRGQRDVVLTSFVRAPARLVLHPADGPLEVVDLTTGEALTELRPAAAGTSLALPAGRYVVRRATAAGVRSVEVTIAPGGRVEVRPADLTLRDPAGIAAKGPEPLQSTRSVVPRGRADLRGTFGMSYAGARYAEVGSGAVPLSTFTAAFAVSERTHVVLPGVVAARLSRDGARWDWFLWGGLHELAVSVPRTPEASLVQARLGLGVDVRRGFRLADLQLSVSTEAKGRWLPTLEGAAATRGFEGMWLDLDQVLSRSFGERVTLSLPVGFAVALARLADEGGVRVRPSVSSGDWRLGSVIGRAGRSVPLLQVHLDSRLSLDGYAHVVGPTRGAYGLGGGLTLSL